MQKFAGQQLFVYNVYGCFLVPFLMEPIATIAAPYYLTCLYVRSRPLSFKDSLHSFGAPMDLGRYADHLVNFSLAIASLFFASGYVLPTLAGLLVSFLFCYMYDRVRVLRYVDCFNYPTAAAENIAHELLAIPCAALAAVAAFQCRIVGAFGLDEGWMVWVVFFAFFLHILLHHLLLRLVRALSKGQSKLCGLSLPYSQVVQRHLTDWFSANKVHCLRTKYVLGLETPTNLIAPGEAWSRRRDEATSIKQVN